MFISILGRQKGISLAELEIVFGDDSVRPLSDSTALVDAPAPDIDRLGGSMKVITDVRELRADNLPTALDEVLEFLGQHVDANSDGKVSVGLSVYDDKLAKVKSIQSFLIKSKKKLRSRGFSVRVIPNKQTELNSAQVLHNKLTSGRNIEIILIKTSSGYWLGKTFGIQNIEALSRRDQERPKRDTRIGMLPPKLALIMLNLAGASKDTDVTRIVLDPFCGTGVVLQEGFLLGLDAYGTDIDSRMIEYSQVNLDWIKNRLDLSSSVRLVQGDATKFDWKKPIDLVVCETYLGPPLGHLPSPRELDEIISVTNSLIKSFLKNIHSQLAEGIRLCVAVPAWRVNHQTKHLPVVDDLENLGYTRHVLENATFDELVYFRPDQIVARELLVLERK